MEKETVVQHVVAEAVVKPPGREQLKVLFYASAVPMIGFGMMDNIVMIQAGQLIDNTIGVTMGLATLTAAAAGQVVSDVSGVIFGGSLERFLHQHKLIKTSTLTAAQRALPISRNVAMLGAVCGVMLGCGLGASCLLFMDLEARERAQRAIQLQAVLNDMMEEAGDGVELHCDSCIIHLAHLPADKHFSTDHTKNTGKTKITVLPTISAQDHEQDSTVSLAVRAAREGRSITNEDASIHCTPVLSQNGEVVAVLEFHTKNQGFADHDKKAAKVMARHIGIFMHRLSD
jgi:Transmembrane protein 65